MDSQEKFWSGVFGDVYTKRNAGPRLLASNMVFFSRCFKSVSEPIKSVLELGANRGMNMHALKQLLPEAELNAVEINKKACAELRKIKGVKVQNASIADFKSAEKFDLVFTKGVLIHLNPEKLKSTYDKMFKLSKRYVLIAEYYNPKPTEIDYRGNQGFLFKRDFAGEMLDRCKGLKLIDYGFAYHRDSLCPQDDISWFLLKKDK